MYTNYYASIPKLFTTRVNCRPEFKKNIQHTAQAKMNVFQTENEIRLEFSLPGVLKENLDLQFKDLILSLKAKRILDEHSNNLKKQEFGSLNYERNVQLSDDVDPETIHAELQNGVLEVRFKKIPKKIIRIEVK